MKTEEIVAKELGTEMDVEAQLRHVLHKYGKPDESIVSKLPKKFKKADGSYGSIELDYVGHAEVTRMLIETDPFWHWAPIGWSEAGSPLISISNGTATMWGQLTVLDKTMLGVGTCSADKPEYSKELISDFLRNAAMRFGICLSLWSKSEWESETIPTKSTTSTSEKSKTPIAPVNIEKLRSELSEEIAKLSDSKKAKLKDLWQKSDLPKLTTLSEENISIASGLVRVLAQFTVDLIVDNKIAETSV